MAENLHSMEMELKNCREALDKALAEKESFQKQAAYHFIEIDKLRKVS